MLFQKGSALVPCVNQALATLKSNGTLGRPGEEVALRRRQRPVLQ